MAKVKLTIAEPTEEEKKALLEEEPTDAFEPAVEGEQADAPQKKSAAAKGGSAKGAASAAGKKEQPVQGLAAWLSKVAPNHENALLGGLLGLAVAVLMFVAGFWRTLFVVVMVTIGVAIGLYLDGTPKIVNFIRRVIAEFRGNN